MNAALIGAIIIGVIVLIIFIALSAVIKEIRSKIRNFCRLAWGTNSITAGIEKMNDEYAQTPKSVSGVTSLYLPRITKDFPEFKFDEMKLRAENVLVFYLLAITKEKPELLTDANRELQDKLKAEIDMLKSLSRREHYESIDIHRTEISAYKKVPGRCIITFQSAVEYYHHTADRSFAPLCGDSTKKKQAKYDIDLIYIQDREMAGNVMDSGVGLNCPNCDAPISGLGAKVCEYCGTPVVELNIHVWTFGNIREVKK